MKVKALVIISIISLFACKSMIKKTPQQVNYIPYFPVVYECDSIYMAKDYKTVAKRLDSLFKFYKPKNTLQEIDSYIKASYLSKQNMDYPKYFKLLVAEYGYQFNKDNTMGEDSLVNAIYIEKLNINKNYVHWREEYKAHSNPELAKTLKKMMLIDQKYRKIDNRDISKLDSIDHINEPKLINILNNGYPNRSVIPRDTLGYITSISSLLLHTKDSIRMAYFAPKVLTYVKTGDCSPSVYAGLIDQYYLYNGEKQIYNSYISNRPLKDSSMTSKMRLKIGLPKSLTINHWVFYQKILQSDLPEKIKKRYLKNIKKSIIK